MFLGIPIAHIHGGELTEGAFDDVIRHSLTKMSYLHFTSTLEYRNRVIQLGENPKLVFNVGGLGAAAISNIKTDLLDKHSLEDELGFKFNKKNLFVTYHPETLSPDRTLSNLIQLLAALDEINGTNIIFSMPNADTGFRDFFEVVEGFVSKKQSCRKVFQSLGQLKYFSCLKYVDAVIGNSSSGILEAPSFKIGTINIGDRQKGRVRADSVIDVSPIKSEILKAIDFLYTAEFQSTLTKVNNPYFKPNTAESIVKILECTELSNLKKSFFDIETKEIFTAHNMQPKTSQNIDSQ
jgi:GDP/UDP-N,N'-diacetylbacillosamine 2-epimerase (hydrolysing)